MLLSCQGLTGCTNFTRLECPVVWPNTSLDDEDVNAPVDMINIYNQSTLSKEDYNVGGPQAIM